MIGPFTSDDCCISTPMLVGPAHLDNCGVLGIGGAEMFIAVSTCENKKSSQTKYSVVYVACSVPVCGQYSL